VLSGNLASGTILNSAGLGLVERGWSGSRSGTHLSFTEAASNSSGKLTVTDGVHTASIMQLAASPRASRTTCLISLIVRHLPDRQRP
jgi:hypothetical protein